jgi:hypothetical protein
MQVDQENLPP